MAFYKMYGGIGGGGVIGAYGAEWAGGESPAWRRTDDAKNFSDPNPYYAGMTDTPSSPFDTISPWKDMVREEDPVAGTVVKIPKYYYKWTRKGDRMKLQISMFPLPGFLTSPAHADRGDGVGERDWVKVGAYHCASDYTSKTGVLPKVDITRATARTAIHNLGSTIWQYDFAMFWTIAMLYLVEYADWNSQAKIGGGCSATTSTSANVFNMGGSDIIAYHTGTVSNSLSAYGECKYRNIEGLISNCFDWCDGIYFDGNDIYAIKNPADFSDTTGGTKISVRPSTSGYIKKYSEPIVSGFEYALYPTLTVSGNGSTYICDYCGYQAAGQTLRIGGDFNQNPYRGIFYVSGSGGASDKGGYVGSRLMILP